MMVNFAQINNKKYLKHLRNNLVEIILKPSKALYFIEKCNVEISYEMAWRLCKCVKWTKWTTFSRILFPVDFRLSWPTMAFYMRYGEE